MQNNHRKGLLIGGLCVALGLAILGTLATARPKHPSPISTGDLTRLDREAQVHFEKARSEIPTVIQRIMDDGLSNLATLLANDKVSGSHETEDYIRKVIEPVLAHCRDGAAVYGCRIDEETAASELSAVSKDHVVSAACGLGGLVTEAIFIRSTLASANAVIGAVASRMAATLTAGAVCAVADGPFPFGDLIALVVAGVGTAWSASDLAEAKSTLPQNLERTLNDVITDWQAACRQAVLQ